MFTDIDDIERELRAALGVQPTSQFERRVLESAADQAQTPRVARTWFGVAAAVILTAGVWALSGVTTVPPMPDPESVTLHADPPPPMDPAPPGRPSARASAGVPALPKARSRQTGTPPSVQGSQERSEPEVLVPANQHALITAFAREIRGGRVRLTEDTGADERLRVLVVPEVTVQPIAIAILEAVSGPGPKGLYE